MPKLKPFEKVLQNKKANFNESDSDPDDDFVEVEDKPGYEATVLAKDHLLGIDFFPSQQQPSTSKVTKYTEIKMEPSVKKVPDINKLSQENRGQQKVLVSYNTEHFWSSGTSSHDGHEWLEINDPTATIYEVEGKA